ncbi:MAG: hypothetical protein CL678_10740, partial [Bdellovibrionaceae bacterium]|nr:hypothetical protein [Pseudobdellovibrionaceae bacterium]
MFGQRAILSLILLLPSVGFSKPNTYWCEVVGSKTTATTFSYFPETLYYAVELNEDEKGPTEVLQEHWFSKNEIHLNSYSPQVRIGAFQTARVKFPFLTPNNFQKLLEDFENPMGFHEIKKFRLPIIRAKLLLDPQKESKKEISIRTYRREIMESIQIDYTCKTIEENSSYALKLLTLNPNFTHLNEVILNQIESENKTLAINAALKALQLNLIFEERDAVFDFIIKNNNDVNIDLIQIGTEETKILAEKLKKSNNQNERQFIRSLLFKSKDDFAPSILLEEYLFTKDTIKNKKTYINAIKKYDLNDSNLSILSEIYEHTLKHENKKLILSLFKKIQS